MAAVPRRRGRSRASIELIEAAARSLEEIAPCSVRAACYRLFVAGFIPSMSKANTDRVSRLLVAAREEEIISWAHIVDETRQVEVISTWSDPQSLIQAAVQQYRKDYWVAQPNRVMVLSEKATVNGTLRPVLDKFGVPLRVLHGFGSATSLYDIAGDSVASDKPYIAIYCGDHDPSGMHMSEVDLPQRLAEYGGEVEIIRVALTADDCTADLPLHSRPTRNALTLGIGGSSKTSARPAGNWMRCRRPSCASASRTPSLVSWISMPGTARLKSKKSSATA